MGRRQLESGRMISAATGVTFSQILGEGWLCGRVAGENVLSRGRVTQTA